MVIIHKKFAIVIHLEKLNRIFLKKHIICFKMTDQDFELELVVIYTTDLDRLRSFYETLGLEFEREKHGKGRSN